MNNSVSTSMLARDGGKPVFPEGPPSWPLMDPEVREALLAAYADGSWGSYHGRHTERLIEQLAERHHLENVWLCASGTVAVEVALRGLGIGDGDEVVLAAYDFPGNFRAIEAVGARPVLVDINCETWCLDAEAVEPALESQTRAILVSHLHGGMAAMSDLRELADRHGMAIVEDACQSPGARVDGRVAGTWGDVGVLSFGGSKLLTAGRGGAILTNRQDVYQRAKIFCERGNDAFPLSELQASVLLPQLEKLPNRNRVRANNVRRLLAQCEGLELLQPLSVPDSGEQASYYKLAWKVLQRAGAPCTREEFLAAMQAEGVAIDAGFRGFGKRSARRCRRVGDLLNSKLAAEDTVLLHHPVLLQPVAVIDQLVQAIGKVVDSFS
ncbi:MAG: aminotransferase class V-fold PLP-dependent enzyme [Planctomycetota bacterium]|nr:aminotransferase class V-fold PLP-dependent enzyme [Planctomycetota bacterium]